MPRKSIDDRIREFREKGDRVKRRTKPVSRDWTLYFMQAGNSGPIKIGLTRGIPTHRREELQRNMPYDLKIVGIILDATTAMEIEFHRRFDHLHIRGEWFRPDRDLMDFIAANAEPWPLHYEKQPDWWRDRVMGDGFTERWRQSQREREAPSET